MGQASSSPGAQCPQKRASPDYDETNPLIVATKGVQAQNTDYSHVCGRVVSNGNRSQRPNCASHRDSVANLCVFCDRLFDGERALEELARTHSPAYRSTARRTGAERAEDQQSRGRRIAYGFCSVCDRDYHRRPEELLDHFILAEKHRNIRCQGGVRPTDDGPELWCALCETRFDRPHSKRKHMREMNHHNQRYRELDAQASRVPGFDHSVLDRPTSRDPGVVVESAPPQRAQRTPIRETVPNVISGITADVTAGIASDMNTPSGMTDDDDPLHYCTPCDRYFLSAEELALHQSEEFCMISTSTPIVLGPDVQRSPVSPSSAQSGSDPSASSAIRQPLSSPPPVPFEHRPSPRRTSRSMNEDVFLASPVSPPNPAPAPVKVPVSQPPPPRSPSPPPPYEAEGNIASLLIPLPSLPSLNVPPLPLGVSAATTATSPSRALPIPPPPPPPSIVGAQRPALPGQIAPNSSADPPPAVTGSSSSATTEGPGIECPLCLDHEINLSSLACGHIFGTECIRNTLEEGPSCPICRGPAALSDLRRIFLA